MGVYVLVHGSWVGGWTWRKVLPLLREAGHDVHTPTLTGLGDRVHLARPEIDLETHITDVVNLFEFEELSNVVLVGHSYGGMVVSGVADRIPEQIDRVIYVDAQVPLDSQSLFMILGPAREAGFEEQARREGDGWLAPPPPNANEGSANARWLHSHMVPHPIGTWRQPIRLRHNPSPPVPPTFIHCTRGKEGQPERAYVTRVRNDPRWRFIELDAGHGPHISIPEQFVDLLLSLD